VRTHVRAFVHEQDFGLFYRFIGGTQGRQSAGQRQTGGAGAYDENIGFENVALHIHIPPSGM
jgi:hypothetical protein